MSIGELTDEWEEPLDAAEREMLKAEFDSRGYRTAGLPAVAEIQSAGSTSHDSERVGSGWTRTGRFLLLLFGAICVLGGLLKLIVPDGWLVLVGLRLMLGVELVRNGVAAYDRPVTALRNGAIVFWVGGLALELSTYFDPSMAFEWWKLVIRTIVATVFALVILRGSAQARARGIDSQSVDEQLTAE